MQVSHFLCSSLPQFKKSFIWGRCCVCGWEGDRCLKKNFVLNKSTGSVAALCPLPTEEICAYCAALWQEPKTYARSIWATEGIIEFPTIAPDLEGKRPAWRDIIRRQDAQKRVAVLSTDPKKRVWPFARISAGDTVALYLHDPSRGISELRYCSLKILCQQLDWIESKMAAWDFSKAAIADSLLRDVKTVQKIGIDFCIEMESEAQLMRLTPEFVPALIIAQKEKEND